MDTRDEPPHVRFGDFNALLQRLYRDDREAFLMIHWVIYEWMVETKSAYGMVKLLPFLGGDGDGSTRPEMEQQVIEKLASLQHSMQQSIKGTLANEPSET